jgi:hypothetical protein
MQNDSQKQSAVAGWLRPILLIIPYMIIVGSFELICYLLLGMDLKNLNSQQTVFQALIISLFTFAGTLLSVSIFRKYVDKESFRSMGFYTAEFRNEILAGLILGALLLTTGFVILILLKEIKLSGINFEPDQLIYGLLLFVFVAFNEELLMRGYILNNLMASIPRIPALLLTSLIFAATHLFNSNINWVGFWNLILAGILLGLPYIYNKRLWFPIALHFAWNFFQGTIFGFNVSGHVSYSVIVQSHKSENIWNGGAFGFEGSILLIVLQIIAIMALWLYYQKKEKTQLRNFQTNPAYSDLITSEE